MRQLPRFWSFVLEKHPGLRFLATFAITQDASKRRICMHMHAGSLAAMGDWYSISPLFDSDQFKACWKECLVRGRTTSAALTKPHQLPRCPSAVESNWRWPHVVCISICRSGRRHASLKLWGIPNVFLSIPAEHTGTLLITVQLGYRGARPRSCPSLEA